MSPPSRPPPADRGFTLIEVLVALVLLTVAATGLSVLFVVSLRDARAARDQTMAMVLGVERMEELRGLTWGLDATGGPMTDVTTDLGRSPPDAAGNGLGPSPANSLDVSTPGYVDYLDGRGQWVGTGATPPAAAVYIRRWQIETLPGAPDTLLLRVLVTTRVRDAPSLSSGQPRTRRADEALIVTLKTRKAG